MGIESHSVSAFEKLMEAVPVITREVMIETLAYLGEQCVTRIRDRSGEESWFDQTGNLRSSIGYLIIDNGATIVDFGFNPDFGKPARKEKVEFVTKDGKEVSFMASKPGGGPEGAQKGKVYAQSLVALYSKGLTLLIVAGMDYADAVEARDGKDVLASTELWAKQEAPRLMERAKEKIERRIAQLQKQLGL